MKERKGNGYVEFVPRLYRCRKWSELNYFPAYHAPKFGGWRDWVSGEIVPEEEVAENYCLGYEDTLSEEDWEYHFS